MRSRKIELDSGVANEEAFKVVSEGCVVRAKEEAVVVAIARPEQVINNSSMGYTLLFEGRNYSIVSVNVEHSYDGFVRTNFECVRVE